MHYHIDMIIYGPPLLNQSSALVGTSIWHAGRAPPVCEIQMDWAGLEPGRPASQTKILTIMLFPRPNRYITIQWVNTCSNGDLLLQPFLELCTQSSVVILKECPCLSELWKIPSHKNTFLCHERNTNIRSTNIGSMVDWWIRVLVFTYKYIVT